MLDTTLTPIVNTKTGDVTYKYFTAANGLPQAAIISPWFLT